MRFETWAAELPIHIKKQPLWKSRYYQMSMYLYDLVWEDYARLEKDVRGKEIARQMIRSAGSISANIEEAYGRGIGTKDHTRILRISLGEARETQGWYFRARHLLSEELLSQRLDIIDQVIALLITTINHNRN